MVEVADGLGLVIEAEHGRGGPAAQHLAAGVEAGGEGGEAEGPPLLCGRQGVDAHACCGNDAERAFTAHEELGEVGSGGGPRSMSFGPHDAAVGQHHLEPDHHVLDLAVAGRVLAGTAAGQPSADRREIHRLRPVPEGVPRAHPTESRLEIGPEGAGSDIGGERGLVDVDEAV